CRHLDLFCDAAPTCPARLGCFRKAKLWLVRSLIQDALSGGSTPPRNPEWCLPGNVRSLSEVSGLVPPGVSRRTLLGHRGGSFVYAEAAFRSVCTRSPS